MYASSGNKHFFLNHVIFKPTKIMNKADKKGHIFRKLSTLKIKVLKKVGVLVSDSSQKKNWERFDQF